MAPTSGAPRPRSNGSPRAPAICRVIARIPAERQDLVLRRFLAGKLVLETVHVEMFNDAGPVAEADITYVALDSYALRRNAGDTARMNPLYDYKRTTSARLVAGLRALEQNKPEAERLFIDPLAAKMARKHGMLMAERFNQALLPRRSPWSPRAPPNPIASPALSPTSRSSRSAPASTRARSGSASPPMPEPSISTCRARSSAAAANSTRSASPPNPNAIDVPIDLLEQDFGAALLAHPEFRADRPAAIIWDGGSMYVKSDRAVELVRSLAAAARTPGFAAVDGLYDARSADQFGRPAGNPGLPHRHPHPGRTLLQRLRRCRRDAGRSRARSGRGPGRRRDRRQLRSVLPLLPLRGGAPAPSSAP